MLGALHILLLILVVTIMPISDVKMKLKVIRNFAHLYYVYFNSQPLRSISDSQSNLTLGKIFNLFEA